MSKKFTVTGLGLTIDKVMVMPGSEMILSAPAPAHWSRFGTSEGKAMEVATPAAGNDGKTKKRTALEAQATKLEITFDDDTSDDDIAAAIKVAKDK